MANIFRIEPEDGGDIGVWGPKELAQNRLALGALTVELYDDAGTLKMSVGKIGIDNESKKGVAEYDTVETVSIAGISSGNWAKVELSVSGTTPTIAATDISGATDEQVIPAAFKDSYDNEKGGYYIDSTKRVVGIVYKTGGGALNLIVNVNSVREGYYDSFGNNYRRGSTWFSPVPVGAVIWWHKSFSGVPSLTESWVECDGSVIDDPESKLDGETLPDINGNLRFIRGGATSGAVQTDAYQYHWHNNKNKNGTTNNNYIADRNSFTDDGTNQIVGWEERATVSGEGQLIAADTIEDVDNSGGTPREATETRPINITMVCIMRIK